MQTQDIYEIFEETCMNFRRDQGIRMAASIAFLSMLSLVPITIFAIIIGQAIFSDSALQNEVIPQISTWFGERAADATRSAFNSASEVTSFTLPAIFSLALLAYSASTVFYELQKALNNVWGVQKDPEEKSFVESLEKRVLAFGLVLLVGTLIIVLLVSTSIIWGVQQDIDNALGGLMLTLVNVAISIGLAFLILILIYKYIPEVDVNWRVLVPPTLLASIAYIVGLAIVQFYISNSTTGSIYQALGSVALVLIFLFYSAGVLFAGAELSEVYAKRIGAEVEVEQGVKVLDEDRLPMPN